MPTKPVMTGRKAIFLNMKEDGLKQRASTIPSKRVYKRKSKYQKDW
jgi:hypothetical protein